MAFWNKKKSVPVKKHPRKWDGQDLIDDKKKFNKGSKFDPDNGDEFDDDPLMELNERIELVAKDNQIRLKDVELLLKDVVHLIPTISELKSEIKSLKVELKEANDRNWELINKLVDKPTAPSAASQYLANKAAAETGKTSGSSATAGPKGRLP